MTATATLPLKRVNERKLETDLGYRFSYLADFIGFGPDDVTAVHGAAPLLAEKVGGLVDAVYVKLFSYDATKRHFVPRQFGYVGPVPEGLESLAMDHDQIKYRKGHLAAYLKRLVTADYDAKMVGYLDFVGKMHTPKAGSPHLDVPLVQMNALIGFVSDALLTTVLGLGLDDETQARTLRAFNKLLWIQNDLITRHYAA